MRRLLIAALLVIGCGDETEVAEGQLSGTAWAASAESCGDALVFGSGGEYRWLHACGASTYVEDGSYAVTDGRLSLVPRSSSCATASPRTDVVQTYVRPGSGELVFGARMFVKVATGPGLSPYAVTGCFADDGTFTARPLQ